MNDADLLNYKDFTLKSTLQGIGRAKSDTPRQAKPLLPSMLLKMFTFLSMSTGHTTWYAAVLCTFRALLRKTR